MNALLAIVVLLAAAGTSRAQRDAKGKGAKPEQLRVLAKLPTVEVTFKFGFNTADLRPSSTNDVPLRSEAELRAVVKASPTNSVAWTDLGKQLTSRAVSNTLHTQSIDLGDRSTLVAAVRSGKLSRDDIHCAKQLVDEAIRCFTKAIEVEPNKPDGYVHRGLWRWILVAVLQSVSDTPDGKPPPPPSPLPPDTTIADIQQAARLRPDDVKLQTASATFLLLSEVITNKLDFGSATGSGAAISRKTHAAITENLSHLENFTSCNDSNIAAAACEGLGIFDYMLNGTNSIAAQRLQRAVTLDPTREDAWDMLVAFYDTAKRDDLVLAACAERVKVAGTVRNRYLLAKAHSHLNRFDKAEEQLRLILTREPKNFLATAGMAAVMLRRDDNPTADEFLHRAERLVTDSVTAAQRADLYSLFAIRALLARNRDTAELYLKEAFKLDPNNEKAKAVRDAMKP